MAADRDDPPISRAEPENDGRAGGPTSRPFTEDVFDDDYYGRSGRRARRSSPLGLIAGIVIGAALAGGGAWYMFSVPEGQGPVAAGPTVIKAETTPYKIKPENPGGMQVANQDKLVYERLAKADAPARVENLLPPPEQPKAPPVPTEQTTPPAPPPKVDSEVQGIVSDMIKTMEAQQAAAKSVLPADAAAPAAEVKAPEPAPTPVVAPATVQTPAPTAQQQVATATPTTPAPEGSFLVQLAAARSEDQAMGEWNRVKGKHEQMFAGMTPSVVRADLGERGVFFRLRAGPLPDRASADAMCTALKAENEACIVVRP